MDTVSYKDIEFRDGKPVLARGVAANPKKRGMNGLEAQYARLLDRRKGEGEVLHWEFEPLRFRLASGAWYKPDFGVLMADSSFELHETKGYWREAARVRIKAVAERFWFFKFVAITKDAGGLHYEWMPPHKEG